MKQTKLLLATIAVLLSSSQTFAYHFKVNDIYYDFITESTCAVTTGEKQYSGSVVIPETVEYDGFTLKVEYIYGYTFSNCKGLSSVTIPNTVISIGENAFSGCIGLTSVTIPNSVKDLGVAVFYNCSTLASIEISNSIKDIPQSAFSGCLELASVIIPSSITNIGDQAFYECKKLTSMTIPNSVRSIGDEVFRGCESLTSVTIPNSVTRVGLVPFASCTSLAKIIVSEGNPNFDSRANCNAIIDTETNSLIQGCKGTTIPNTITAIGNEAFSGCKGLTSMKIPSSVTSIGNSAFYGCTSLTSVTIPNSVINIGSSAFQGCKKISSISIPNSVINIGSSAFAQCESLKSIVVPNSATEIGTSTFDNCSNLKSVTIGTSVRSIGQYAFNACTKLQTITIPNSVTSIGRGAFMSCYSLSSLTIPNSVNSIGYGAFTYCTGLTSITIPSSVTEFGEYAFNRCDILTEIICESATPATAYDNTFTDVQTKAVLSIPAGSKKAYANSAGWKNFTNIIEYSLTPEYTISYMVDDEVYYTAVIEQGAEIPTIDTPEKEGYTFTGWENLPSTMPDEDVTVYAKFTPNNYTVTFKANNAIVSSESLAYGTTIVAPEAPEIEDYAFVEWTDFIETVPAHDVEFVAVYKQVGTHIIDGVISFNQDEAISYDRIRYTRTFNNTNWQALYVPFEIPVTEAFLEDFEVAYLNDVRQYDRDDDGVKDETVIEAFKVTSGTLEASYPYLIRAKKVGEKTITVTDATLYAAEENSIDCSSIREKFTFTGTYSQLSSEELPQGEGYYALSGGVWQPVAEGASLGAFRFYLKVDSRDGSNAGQSNAIRMRIIGENGEEDCTTGIEEIINQKSEIIYDLQGRRVENPTKGMYIVNGKKTLIK